MTRSPQLMLLLPPCDVPLDPKAVRSAVEALPFAAVVIGPGADRSVAEAARVLVPLIQSRGAAALLSAPEDVRLVARVGADGAQYRFDSNGLEDAIATLRPGRIAGIGGLRTRHDAMEAGERDIDYVLFGEPRADGSVPEVEKTRERAEWWAEIFTTPAAAYAETLDAARQIADTGVEFVAVGPWLLTAGPAALEELAAFFPAPSGTN